MKKIFTLSFIIVILFCSLGFTNSIINPEFKRVMTKYGYPDKLYQTKPIIEKEMNLYGTNLRAFQVRIGEEVDGFLTKNAFEKWQKWKEFKKKSWYRDNNPYVESDQGQIRIVSQKINISDNEIQFIHDLESYDNKIIIAFNLRNYPEFAREGVVVCGHGGSRQLLKKYLKPLKGLQGFYIIEVPLLFDQIFHFRIVKFGLNYASLSGVFPFEISYSDLFKKKLIKEEIKRKYNKTKCQAIRRSNNGNSIEFVK